MFQAAKYLDVPPWELLKQSIWYQDRALVALDTEYKAQKMKEARKQ